MGNQHIIEPNQVNRIHLVHFSDIYEVYYHYLSIHSKSDALELTRRYVVKTIHKSIEEQLAAFEFLYMNDFFDELENELHKKHYDKGAALVYSIILKRKDTPLTEDELAELESLHFTHPSLQSLRLFLLVYAHYDLKQYQGMDKYADEIQASLFTINEPLLHYYLKLRYDEISFVHYWKTNNLILAKKFAYKFINSDLAPRKYTAMHHHLALCNAFHDYDEAMYYANKAADLAEKHRLTRALKSVSEHTIPFISAFHEKVGDIHTPDPVETAHINIMKGDLEPAITYLSSLNTLTPFQQSYLGLATRDKSLLLEAKDRFINQYGDMFFAQLPEQYLLRVDSIKKEAVEI
ncbi:AimR family lysis-lysogeny pheromone receptor [Halobacillus yeomjeoni]|uniref:AimR family lysis-lysogeny pheromone receptor n=1 Tax=Halobacillus yeomjeoni TaxID=311194 RepID=UPI001CD491AD|nr:AimR family lysis-lysogeny pheromone receptor [Halobacillus yeomjeoni]MCA0985019.1 AimR family lysis-lysogeny pheromone receptor [Halobacillus yeomjeoni]